MSLLSQYPNELVPPRGLETSLEDTQEDLPGLRAQDEQLLAELYAKNQENQGYVSEKTGLRFANAELASLAKETYTAEDLAHLESFLEQKGTLNIPLQTAEITIDGVVTPITFVAATEIDPNTPNHGDMSSMVYLRDHIQAARVLFELYAQDPETYVQEGELCRTLLISGLHLLSTPAQLDRFDKVITLGKDAGQEDWPHISLHFNDLEAKGPNGWRNIQDTVQMLADFTLDTLDRGFLRVDELSDAHKQMLGSIAPLLTSVGYPKYENSGSWEEVVACRTSVMEIEASVLAKINLFTAGDGIYEFLKGGFERSKANLSGAYQDFSTTVDQLLDAGLHEIGRRQFYESPEYDKTSIKYREADAAAVYGLMYGIPKLLADAKIPIEPSGAALSELQIKDLIKEQLDRLSDPLTGGVFRYEDDSYQRENFHTNTVQLVIRSIKRQVKQEAEQTGGGIDLDKKQALRGQWTPQGRPAAWAHELGQEGSCDARDSLTEIDPVIAEKNRTDATKLLNRLLSMVTGGGQSHATLGDDGLYQVTPVPAFRVPENIITYRYGDTLFTVPSPHTPLNWGSSELKHLIGLLRISMARAEAEA